MNNEEEGMNWEPMYSEWGGGGWCVMNIRYPNGACGCVARGVNGGWAIVCHPDAGEYRTRDDAARAEYGRVKALKGETA